MEGIFFSGSITFLLIGSSVGLFYPVLRNISFYMIMPLLMILTGLSPEMAIVISLAHLAALLVPSVVEQLHLGNIDFKLTSYLFLGIVAGIWIGNDFYQPTSLIHKQQQIIVLIPYLCLMIGAIAYRIHPFPLLPKPNHKIRKKLEKILKVLPGKVLFSTSGIRIPFFIPIFFGILVALIGKFFGPVVALLMAPLLIVGLDVPVMVAVGTAMLVNLIGMLTFVVYSDFLAIPLYLQILLWLFLGSTLTMLFLSSFLQRKPYPLPVAAVLVIITSVTLVALSVSDPGLNLLMKHLGFPSNLLGWFGGVRG